MFSDGGGASLGTAQGEITIDVSQAENSLQSLGGALGSFTTRATSVGQSVSTFQQSAVGLAQGMQNVGRVVQDLGSTIEQPFLLAATSAMDLESTMAGVNAVMDLTGAQFQDLTGLAQQLGKDTAFSGTQAAQGIEELGKAGISFEDIMGGAAAAATDLAAAGGVEVPKAATVMAAAMQQFGIAGEDAAHVADVLAGAANASLSDVNQLGIGLAQVGGVANAAGMDIDETATFMAVMANNGIRGSDAATSMKNAILAMLAPTDKAATVMQEMGVSVLDATGNFKGLEGVSRDFFEVWKNSGKTMAEFLDPLTNVLGRDAVRSILFGMQAIQDEQDGLSSGWKQMESQVTKAGTAHEVAQKRMDSLAGSIEKLKGSLDVLGENIGLPIITGIRPVVDAMTEFVNKLVELPPAVLASIGVIGSLVGVLVSLGGSFLVVGGYILEAVARFEATGISLGEIAAIAGRVTLGLTLIGVAAAAVALAISTNFLGIRDAIQAVMDKIQELIDRFQLFFNIGKAEAGDQGPQGKGFWSDLAQNISAAGRAIDATFGTDLSPFFDTLAKGADNFEHMRVGLQHAADQMKIFTDASTKITPLAKRVDAMGKVLKNVFGVDSAGFFSNLANGIDAFSASMDSLAEKNITGVAAILASLARGLNEAFGDNGVADALAKTASVIATFQNTFNSLLNDGINPVTAAMRGMAAAADLLHMDGLALALENGAQFAQDFADSFSNAQDAVAQHGIEGLPQLILALNSAMLQTIGIGLPDFLIGAANAMAAFQTAFSNGIQNGLNPFEAAIKGVGAAIGSIFGTDARTNFFNLVDAVRELGTAASGLVQSGFDRVGQMFSEIGTALSQGDIQGGLDAVKSLIADIGTELQTAGQKALDWAINVGEPALAGWAAEQAGKFGDWIKEKLGVAGDLAGQTLAKIENWFIEVGIPQATGWLQQTGADVISWIQDQLDRLIPAAGQKLGELKDWVFEVGVPDIQEAAGEAGSIKDQIIQWIGDQIQFPDVSELPDISAGAQAFGENLGATIAKLLADAMATVRAAIFGGGGGGGTGGGLTNVAKGENAGLFNGIEADARQLAGTIVGSFLRGLGAGFAEAVGQANVATFISTGDFEPLKTQIKTALGDALAELPGEIQELLTHTQDEIIAIIKTFGSVIGDLLSQIGSVTTLSGGVPGNAPGGGATTSNLFQGLADKIQRDFASFKNSLDNLIPDNPFQGIVDAIQGFATSAQADIQNITDIFFGDLNTTAGESAAQSAAATNPQVEAAGIAAGEKTMTTLGDGYTNGISNSANVGDKVANTIGLAAETWPIVSQLNAAGAKITSAAGVSAEESGLATGQSFADHFSSQAANAIGTGMDAAGSQITDAAASGATSATASIGPIIDQAMATQLAGFTLTQLSQAIGQKIGEAVVAGLTEASTANVGGSGGGTTAGGIGQSIVGSLTTSIQTADFSAVGTAISTQIGVALSAGFGQAEARGPSTAGVDIGSQIALSLASAITGSDFTVVSQAIQQKIGQSLSGGTGGTAAQTDTSAVAGEGATIGASIAASLANAILTSDFTVVGQAIQQKISQAVASASSGATTGGAGAGLGGVVGQGGGIASGIVASIVSEFTTADYSGIGTAVSTGISEAITTGMQNVNVAVIDGMGTALENGMVAAESASEIGSVFSEAVAGTISSTSGQIDIAATTSMTTAVTSATGVASAAGTVGTAFTTAVGAGIGGGTGTVTGAATATMTSAISAASGAAAGGSASGAALDTAIGGGIGSGAGTVTGAAQAVMNSAVAAASGIASSAGGAIGAALDQGIASGIGANAGVVIAAAEAVVNSAVAAAQGAGGISSPSKVMITEVGEPLAEGVIIGMDKKGPDVDKAAQRLINRIVNHVKDMRPLVNEMTALAASWAGLPILDQIGSQLETVAGHIDSTIGSVKDSMKDVFKSISDTIKHGRDNLKGESAGVASDATSSFNDILKDKKSTIRDAMKTTKGGILDISALQQDVDSLRNQSKILARADGGQVFADRINAMADSLQSDKDTALSAAISLFQGLQDQLENAKKQHRKKGKESGSEIEAGITEGITTSTGEATSSIDSLTDTVINTFNANLSRLPEMATAIGESIGNGLATGLDNTQGTVETSTTNLTDQVTGGIDSEVPTMEGSATTAADKFTTALNSTIQGAVGTVGQSGSDVGTALSDGATTMIADSPIRSAVTDFVTGLTGEIQSSIGTVNNAGQDIGTAFTSGVSTAAPTSTGKGLTDQVETGITSGVPSAANAAETAGSTIGSSMEAGIADACKPVNDQATGLTDTCVPEGIDAGLPTATRSAATAGGDISDALKGAMELKKKDVTQSFKGAGEGFGSSLAGAITGKTAENTTAVKGIATAIGGISANSEGNKVGVSFGAGLVQGITSKKSDIETAAREVIHAAEVAANDEAGSNSPSTLFATVGLNMMLGLESGLREGTAGVIDQSTKTTRDIAKVFAGQGMGTAVNMLQNNLGLYTQSIKEALADTEDVVKKSPFGNVLLPTDNSKIARDTRNNQKLTPVNTERSVTIGSITVQKGSKAEKMLLDLADHLQETSGQYVRTK